MRKYIVYKIVGLALLVVAFAGCDTASQDVEPVVSPDDYPMVVFQSDATGTTVHEGDTVTFTITFDKMIDRSVTFHVKQTGGTAEEDVDYVVETATIQPYSLEAELRIIFIMDDIPETEDLSFQGVIEVPSLADKYLVNPDVVYPTMDYTLKSVNDPTLLTIMFSWPTEDDIDIVTWSDTEDYPMTEWGAGGATGANPEFDKAIWLSDPPGTYYVNIMHWGAPPFDYTFTLGYPDQTVEVITGRFDSDHLEKYTLDWWTAWGGDPGYDSYRILKVENDNSKFTVTKLAEL
jgi:hypothetical protein